MSAATTRPAVGVRLTTTQELDALPAYAVVLADPDGRSPFERDRCLSIQKRPGDTAEDCSWWYPAWDTDIWNALATMEVVHRFHLGPFAVVWLPPVTPDVEAAA